MVVQVTEEKKIKENIFSSARNRNFRTNLKAEHQKLNTVSNSVVTWIYSLFALYKKNFETILINAPTEFIELT